MLKWVSAALALAVLLSPDVAIADTPADVYSDFAEDGVLSCGHSRSALEGVLNDASLNQYGDPATLIGLKLAVRKQLAGGCRRNRREPALLGSPGSGSPPSGPADGSDQAGSSGGEPEQATRPADPSQRDGGSLSDRRDGWMVLLGVVLLLVTLGSGGWAARRAFGDQP